MSYEYEMAPRLGNAHDAKIGDLSVEPPDTQIRQRSGARDHAAPMYKDRRQLRTFLVACRLASVSVETMSRQLGLDEETICRELCAGIDAWNAAQSRGR